MPVLTVGKPDITPAMYAVFSDPHPIRQTSGELATQPDDMRSPSAGAGHPFPSLLERARAIEPLEWRDGPWLARLFSEAWGHYAVIHYSKP